MAESARRQLFPAGLCAGIDPYRGRVSAMVKQSRAVGVSFIEMNSDPAATTVGIQLPGRMTAWGTDEELADPGYQVVGGTRSVSEIPFGQLRAALADAPDGCQDPQRVW